MGMGRMRERRAGGSTHHEACLSSIAQAGSAFPAVQPQRPATLYRTPSQPAHWCDQTARRAPRRRRPRRQRRPPPGAAWSHGWRASCRAAPPGRLQGRWGEQGRRRGGFWGCRRLPPVERPSHPCAAHPRSPFRICQRAPRLYAALTSLPSGRQGSGGCAGQLPLRHSEPGTARRLGQRSRRCLNAENAPICSFVAHSSGRRKRTARPLLRVLSAISEAIMSIQE